MSSFYDISFNDQIKLQVSPFKNFCSAIKKVRNITFIANNITATLFLKFMPVLSLKNASSTILGLFNLKNTMF